MIQAIESLAAAFCFSLVGVLSVVLAAVLSSLLSPDLLTSPWVYVAAGLIALALRSH